MKVPTNRNSSIQHSVNIQYYRSCLFWNLNEAERYLAPLKLQ